MKIKLSILAKALHISLKYLMNIYRLELKNEIANFQSIMHYGADNNLIKEHLSKTMRL